MESGSSDSDEDVKEFKVVVVGNPGVGKTQLVRRLCELSVRNDYQPTLGVEFLARRIVLPNSSVNVTLQISDIAGAELEKNMMDHYLSNANAILFVYDTGNLSSFKEVDGWKSCISRVFEGKSAVPKMALVGNKVDLPSRAVPETEHEKEAAAYGMDAFYVSAITGHNVIQMFTKVAADLVGHTVAADDLLWSGQIPLPVETISSPPSRKVARNLKPRSNDDRCHIM